MIATRHRKRLGAAARRETIISAAAPQFAASGYERTRVGDIATKVGVTEPVVFQNFGTKSGLFVAVIDRMAEEAAGFLSALASDSPDVAKVLSALLAHEHQDRLHGPGAFGSTFADAAQSAEPAVRRAGRRAHARMMQALVDLLEHGQRDGSIRKDVEATALGWLILSQIHARQFRRKHSETSVALEGSMLEALMAALRPRPS
jgi:AcrR family transcriptional regulator